MVSIITSAKTGLSNLVTTVTARAASSTVELALSRGGANVSTPSGKPLLLTAPTASKPMLYLAPPIKQVEVPTIQYREAIKPEHRLIAADARKSFAVSDQLLLWSQMENRRMSGTAEMYDEDLGGSLVRADNYPGHPATPESARFPGEAKSSVTARYSLIPAGVDDIATLHVRGTYPAKGLSAFTSVVHSSQLTPDVLKIMQSWGKYGIVVPTSQAITISGKNLQELLRHEGHVFDEFAKPALMRDGTPWRPEHDSMFKSSDPRQVERDIEMIARLGIDPDKDIFTDSERARIYSGKMNEVLVLGATAEGSATVATLNDKLLESVMESAQAIALGPLVTE